MKNDTFATVFKRSCKKIMLGGLITVGLTVFYVFNFNQQSLQQGAQLSLAEKRSLHEAILIDDQHLWPIAAELSNISEVDHALDNILIPRVPGSDGHRQVNAYIKNVMQSLGWQVDTDAFEDITPGKHGKLPFENIIATLNPNAERFLILACHYDSKYMENINFVGAIDSAVPCAIMLNLAVILTKYLKNSVRTDISLQYVFFDGEEAFVTWSNTDSIYGARHLAAKWEKEDFLKRIDALCLLDLLGTSNPTFYSYFKETHKWYSQITGIERRLNNIGAIERDAHNSAVSQPPSTFYFQSFSVKAQIEDDHIPFLQRNVPILHIIPLPFPDCWHEASDDRSAIDSSTIRNLNKIFGIFILEYLNTAIA